MRAHIMTAACLVAWATTGCTPAFNWREVPITPTPLNTLFPCKPEKGHRKVAMAGHETELFMAHCDTGGVTVAVGHARLADPGQAGPALAQWRVATLAGMRVSTSRSAAWTMDGAPAMPEAVSVDASGTGADGKPIHLRAAWFSRDGEVYAALLYGPAWAADVADAFFGGLRFR